MLSASVKAIPLSQSPPMRDPMPMSRPSPPHPQTATVASGSISSAPSPRQASMSTRRPSFNIRDFMVDNDADQATSSMFKFMDEDAIIRAQVEALEALNEAALTRALRESEAMAASEKERRKQAERAVETSNDSDASPAMNSAVVPVIDQAIREPQVTPQPSSSPPSESTMPIERYNTDEAAARLLAREWRVASLQGALLKNPDITPPPHTSTSTSHIPTSSTPTSSPAPTPSLPRKVPLSSTRPPPITIPAEEFFARSPPKVHHRQSSLTTSRASASSKPSPVLPTGAVGDLKDKPLPRRYTSASSAAASQSATKSADRANPAPQGASSSINTHIKTQQVSSASSKPNSSITRDTGKAPAETVSTRRATSPEKPRTVNHSPAVSSSGEQKQGIDIKSTEKSAHTSTTMRVTDAQQSPASSRSSSATTSPRSTPNTSPGISPSSSLSASLNVSTSASKFAAAERERARASKQMLMFVPVPAATSTPVKPVAIAAHRKTSTSSHLPASLDTSPSSSVLMSPPPFQNSAVQARSVLLEPSTQKAAPPSEAQLVPTPVPTPVKKENQNPMVVPISSLSESDDEDDGTSDSEDEDEGWEVIDYESVPLRDLFTSSHSCTKCGEGILSPRNILYKPSESMHISCIKCATLYCRGCFTIAKCPKNCSGSKACSLTSCCSQVGSVAIFEALSSFDHDFLREAGLSATQKSEREKYIQSMITRNGASELEKIFVQTTRTLVTLLTSSTQIDPSVGELFERAMLTEVVHGFLSNQVIRDWIAHSDAYCAILDLLRYMVDAGLGDAMALPLKRSVATSCGLKKWMWGTGTIIWAADSYSQRDPNKGQELYRGELKGGTEECASLGVNENLGVSAVPLGELVNQLETLTGPLSSLSQKLQFSATVQKVNALCDRISQLVIQQVLASF